MHWSDRMKTKINVGEKYLTRNGTQVEVLEKLSENDFQIKSLNEKSFLKHYIVNSNGGFGNYPNHHDLINKI